MGFLMKIAHVQQFFEAGRESVGLCAKIDAFGISCLVLRRPMPMKVRVVYSSIY